jgi:hypothetical protein
MKKLNPRTRFDLEQDIMAVWGVKEELEMFLTEYIDGKQVMGEDDVWNYIHGIAMVSDLRSKRLWETFRQVLELDEYAPEEVKAKRPKGMK